MHKLATLCALLMTGGAAFAQGGDLDMAMLLPGRIDDNGFMEAGHKGLLRIQKEFGADISHSEGIKPERDLLAEALRELAERKPDMVIAHGGQNSEAARIIAAEYPDIRFVIVQGHVTGPNLSSYEVLQEESAWLAGAAAGLLTETDVVGNVSGIRVPPGGRWQPGVVKAIGLGNPAAVSLALSADVPVDVRARIDGLRDQIVAGRITVATDHDGAEPAP